MSWTWILSLKLHCCRLLSSYQLENSLQNGKALLSTYENKLAREEIAPSNLTSLEKTQRELAVSFVIHATFFSWSFFPRFTMHSSQMYSCLQDIASELRSKRSVITETEQNLREAKASCSNMANKVQEHCPDIERQEADVQKLTKRFDNLNRQTEARWVHIKPRLFQIGVSFKKIT